MTEGILFDFKDIIMHNFGFDFSTESTPADIILEYLKTLYISMTRTVSSAQCEALVIKALIEATEANICFYSKFIKNQIGIDPACLENKLGRIDSRIEKLHEFLREAECNSDSVGLANNWPTLY
jgi:hypothetical protein